LLPLVQGGALQPAADALAERLQVRPDLLGYTALVPQPCQLLPLACQGLPPCGDLLTALFQLGQVDDFGLVGIDQPLFLAVEALTTSHVPFARQTAPSA
jgi:hypothetical protein